MQYPANKACPWYSRVMINKMNKKAMVYVISILFIFLIRVATAYSQESMNTVAESQVPVIKIIKKEQNKILTGQSIQIERKDPPQEYSPQNPDLIYKCNDKNINDGPVCGRKVTPHPCLIPPCPFTESWSTFSNSAQACATTYVHEYALDECIPLENSHGKSLHMTGNKGDGSN
jgi:hypothetical protein